MGSLFYVASKIGFFLVQPSNVLLVVAITGLMLARLPRWRTAGWRLSASGLAALLVAGFSPLGNALLLPLEQRFQRPPVAAFGDVAGIIILGGFEHGHLTTARGILSLNEAAERLTEAASLARKLPAAKVVFSGGAGALIGKGEIAAPEVRAFLIDAGIAPARIVVEDASRNTRENATMTRDLVRPKPGERWLLVTSAFHMPRSIGLFRQAGFEVLAWPVDYRVGGIGDLVRFGDSIDGGLLRTDIAAKEYFGLAVYRLAGWTDSLWPGP